MSQLATSGPTGPLRAMKFLGNYLFQSKSQSKGQSKGQSAAQTAGQTDQSKNNNKKSKKQVEALAQNHKISLDTIDQICVKLSCILYTSKSLKAMNQCLIRQYKAKSQI